MVGKCPKIKVGNYLNDNKIKYKRIIKTLENVAFSRVFCMKRFSRTVLNFVKWYR